MAQIHPQKVDSNFLNLGLLKHSNFTAILELVDNSIDACSKNIFLNLRDPKSSKTNNSYYSYKEPVFEILDDGRGIDSLKKLINVGSSKPQDTKAVLGENIGLYGLGFKTSVPRIGKFSLIFSSCQGSNTNRQDKVMIGIWPYLPEEPSSDNQSSTSSTKSKNSKSNSNPNQNPDDKTFLDPSELTYITQDIKNQKITSILLFHNRQGYIQIGWSNITHLHM